MPTEEAFVLGRIEQRFGLPADGEVKPPRLEDIKLDPPRLDPRCVAEAVTAITSVRRNCGESAKALGRESEPTMWSG
jgi:hypothetical protein